MINESIMLFAVELFWFSAIRGDYSDIDEGLCVGSLK